MYFSQWTVPLILFVTNTGFASAKTVSAPPAVSMRSRFNQSAKSLSESFEAELERRNSQQDSGNMNSSPNNTQAACSDAISNLTIVSNPAGFGACYNILDWQENSTRFQADLRLFQVSEPTDLFADQDTKDITVILTYPSSTQFQVLTNMKRSISAINRRDGNVVEIQDYSLQCNFKTDVDLSRLNMTELMSLMIPQIQIQSPTTNQTRQTFNLSISDIVYFVTGQFQNSASTAMIAQATNPNMAALAITASQKFVLPGTSLGIFPTGLIITSVWTLLFVFAYGFGTYCRMRHRDIYRKRIAATLGMKFGGGWMTRRL